MENQTSSIPIDIVIPCLEKDLETLSEVIDSIRDFVRHPVSQIIVISPISTKIKSLCRRKRCRWINEARMLPIQKSDINLKVNGLNRSGWIFQQLLKWEASKYVKSQYFLVQESDTIYIRPHIFLQGKRAIFACSSAIPHIPYFEAYRRIFGESVRPWRYLTSHHMLFSKKILAEAKKLIEKKSGKPWYEAIISHVDRSKMSSISDYESYGQYVVKHHPNTVVFEEWANHSFPRHKLKHLKSLKSTYSQNTKTLSFHSYH